jgi:ATP-binding cassette subfamily B protein
MFHGGGWGAFLSYDEKKDQPQVDRALLRRIAGYALPYWFQSALMLLAIAVTSFIDLVPPLLYRDLIDHALPNRDLTRLNLLALGMVGLPIVSGLIGVAQRYLSAQIGEGIIFDLRQQMYEHMQRMSLRFFTLTKTGEMMSRFSNDVVGAQNAVTGTLVNIVTNVIVLVSTLAIMLSIDWRLTVLSIAVLPLFVIPTRRIGRIVRDLSRQSMEINARMNTLMNETLGVSGALLVKAFGRQKYEIDRYRKANFEVRDIGVQRAMAARWFFLGLGLVSAVGTGLVYWAGGHLVLSRALTVGTIVAFAVYLVRLYQPLSSLANVRVEFATSMVSFERVFEYLDLPVEIQDRPDAAELRAVQGHVQFDHVSFSYLTETTNDERPTTDDRRRTTDDRRPTTDDRRPTTDDRRPTTNDRRPTTNDRRPTTNGIRPLSFVLRLSSFVLRLSSFVLRLSSFVLRRWSGCPSTRPASGRCMTCRSRSGPASLPRWSALAAPARPRSPTCCPGCTTRRAGTF